MAKALNRDSSRILGQYKSSSSVLVYVTLMFMLIIRADRNFLTVKDEVGYTQRARTIVGHFPAGYVICGFEYSFL